MPTIHEGGVSNLHNLNITGDVINPLPIRTLFSGTGTVTFDRTTGIIGTTIGSTSGTVAAGNDPRFSTPNVIIVKNSNPGAGEFTSIAAAVATITNATPANTWLVSISPGLYFEPTIHVPPCVYLRGSGRLETKIVGIDPSGVTLSLSESTEIVDLAILGMQDSFGNTVPGTIGVLFNSFGSRFPTILDHCLLSNAATLFKVHSSLPTDAQIATYGSQLPTPDTMLALTDCAFGPTIGATLGVDILSDSGTTTSMYLTQILAYDTAPHAETFIRASDPGSLVVISGTVLSIVGTVPVNSTAIEINNGAEARIYDCILKSYDTGILVNKGGAPPILNIFGLTCHECNRNMAVNHPGTTGICTSYINESKTFINSQALFHAVGRDFNIIYVSGKTGDYNTLESAAASINPLVTCVVANDNMGSPTLLTSTGLFNIIMDSVSVTSVDIPPGTISTFIDNNTISLSNACTSVAGTTVNATFIRATPLNSYGIEIGSGIYTVSETTLPNYVNMYSESGNVTFNQSGTIHIGHQCSIKNIIFKSTAFTVTGIRINSAINVLFQDCTFIGFAEGVLVTSTLVATAEFAPSFVQCKFIANIIGIHVDGSTDTGSITPINFSVTNSNFDGLYNPLAAYGIRAEGSNATVGAAIVDIINYSNGVGVFIDDAASLTITSSRITKCDNAIIVGNSGIVGSKLQASSIIIEETYLMDINILHPSTTGVISGIFQRSKTYINPLSSIVMNFTDHVVSGSTIVGSVFIGDTNNTVCDVSDLIEHSIPVGLLSGGIITAGIGLNVIVAAGNGYTSSSGGVLQKLIWPQTTVALTANAQNYICVNMLGTSTQVVNLTINPDSTTHIFLGRVITSLSGIEFMDRCAINTQFMGNLQENVTRDTVGAIFPPGGGSLVSPVFVPAVGLVPAQINVAITAGKYYYGQSKFLPSGQAAPATFNTYCHRSGVVTSIKGVTTIDYNNYDNGTDLTPLPAGQYTKHSFYLVGDGIAETYMLVYGTNVYTTEAYSITGSLPLPPSYFREGVVLIASFIVQQGVPTYCMTESQRPIYGFVSTGVNGNIINHSELLNLDHDDHLQYFRTDGSRAMVGNITMAGHNIVGIGTANGVKIESHASRHLINGTDPLPTGDPAPINANTVTAQGSGPGISLSDHTHQLSMATTGSTLVPDTSPLAAVGTSSTIARGDHTHIVPTATAVSIGSSNTIGNSLTYFSRSDHRHQGIHSLKANNAGTSRFGDITLSTTGLLSITDDGVGNFTFTYPRIPQQLHQRFGSGASGDSNIGIKIPGNTPTLWTVSSNFVYQGSLINSGNISKFGIVYSMPSGDTVYSARIFDVTNNNVITTISGLGGVQTQHYVYTASIANIPVNPAVFELQFSRTGGANNALILYCMYFEY
jgi:hypothetical protein